MNETNPYIPYQTRIEDVRIENEARDLKTFTLVFIDPEQRKQFQHKIGQFVELSLIGYGEIPIGIASSPLDQEYIQFTIKRYPNGVVTSAIHNCDVGDIVGVRGPLGNSFPEDEMEGRNILIIGGGFAFTTLRAAIRYILHENNRSKYKNITLIYGARSPGELLYKDELKHWEQRNDIEVHITVDKGDDTWTGKEGFVPAVTRQVAPSAENTIAIVCGPPIMVKFTIPELTKLDFKPEMIINSLEMRMKCGIGKCGRCNIGDKYVCVDGPVFSYAELLNMPEEF